MEKAEGKNNRLGFVKLVEDLQSKFDKVFEYVQILRKENEELKMKVASLEQEVEALKHENEELRRNGVVLFPKDEQEEVKKRIISLLERINRYL